MLALDPAREFRGPRYVTSKAGVRESECVSVDGVHDEQPLEAIRAEVVKTFLAIR